MHLYQEQAAPLQTLGRLDETLAGKTCIAVTSSLFVAVCAHVSLPLLFTPVPLTLGNFAVILVGLVLGPRLGFASPMLYLAEGASGLPVFNPGGLGGVAQLLGPTGGYLFAYPFAAALAGWLVKWMARVQGRFLSALIASFCATTLLLSSGLFWLARTHHLALQAALIVGVIPFLPGEVMKIVIAAGVFKTLSRHSKTQA